MLSPGYRLFCRLLPRLPGGPTLTKRKDSVHFIAIEADLPQTQPMTAGKVNSMEAMMLIRWARRVEDILAGFGEVSKKPADLGSIPSESVLPPWN